MIATILVTLMFTVGIGLGTYYVFYAVNYIVKKITSSDIVSNIIAGAFSIYVDINIAMKEKYAPITVATTIPAILIAAYAIYNIAPIIKNDSNEAKKKKRTITEDDLKAFTVNKQSKAVDEIKSEPLQSSDGDDVNEERSMKPQEASITNEASNDTMVKSSETPIPVSTDKINAPTDNNALKNGYSEKKPQSKYILTGVAILAAVGSIIGGVFLMKNKDDKKSDSLSSSAKVEATSDAISMEEAASTQENTTEAIATTTEQITETTTTTTVETTTAPAETTTQPQENSIKAFPATEISNYPQYIQAIKDGINNGYYTASSASYALYDLNKDGTPEMIINTAPYGIYAMDGNNCVEIQSTFKATRSPSLSITEKGFVKLSFVDTMGNSSVTYWKYFGGSELAMQDGGEYGNDIALEMTPVSSISFSDDAVDYHTDHRSGAYAGFPFWDTNFPMVVSTDSGSLNLRARPDTNAAIITTIPKDAYVDVLGDDGSWCYVMYNNGSTYYGYVSKQYLKNMDASNPY